MCIFYNFPSDELVQVAEVVLRRKTVGRVRRNGFPRDSHGVQPKAKPDVFKEL
jgi:hypothetical protein